MLRRLAALLVAALLIPLLAACGHSGSSSATTGLGGKTAPGFDAVKVSGDVGKAPQVSWKAQMTASANATKTLVQGTGDAVAKGGSVLAYVYIGNGYSKEKAYSDYDNGAPETLTDDTKSLSPVFADAITGAKIGSRVATVTKASKVFGASSQQAIQLGVSDTDPLLVIIDIVGKGVDKPTDVTPDKLPKLKLKKGKPSGFDFTGIAKPEQYGELLRTTLKQGKGAAVTADDTVTVNYLGETYQATKPFDESYSKQPASFGLSQVVKGWTLGLTGVKVGSRVLLQIPPTLGYGGKAQDNIPANSTLYFVVDVIKATQASASASPTAPAASPSAAAPSPSATQ